MNLLSDARSTGLSILKDPFAAKLIESIRLNAWKNYNGDFQFYATVEFQNGDTKGEQKIIGSSFDDLISKTKAFIETLQPKVTT